MYKNVEDIVTKDLLELLDLNDLSDEKKSDLYRQALETVQNRTLARIAAKLGEEKKERLLDIADSGDEERFQEFLRQNGVNYGELLMEETLLYKQEMAHSYAALKRQKEERDVGRER